MLIVMCRRIFAGIGEVARHHAAAQPLAKDRGAVRSVSGHHDDDSSPAVAGRDVHRPRLAPQQLTDLPQTESPAMLPRVYVDRFETAMSASKIVSASCTARRSSSWVSCLSQEAAVRKTGQRIGRRQLFEPLFVGDGRSRSRNAFSIADTGGF